MGRAMWGSDQAASLEPNGVTRLVRDIRLIELSFGSGMKRVLDVEKPLIKKLRRVVGEPKSLPQTQPKSLPQTLWAATNELSPVYGNVEIGVS